MSKYIKVPFIHNTLPIAWLKLIFYVSISQMNVWEEKESVQMNVYVTYLLFGKAIVKAQSQLNTPIFLCYQYPIFLPPFFLTLLKSCTEQSLTTTCFRSTFNNLSQKCHISLLLSILLLLHPILFVGRRVR